MLRIKQIKAALAGVIMLGCTVSAEAFVLIGQPNPNETVLFNYTEEMGAPKSIDRGVKRLFRWNIPYFTYSFDASFVYYFGEDGMNAVHDAFGVVNDFFENDDYSGVSELDLARHGFLGNYNTTWINTTAENAQIIDIKSLTLGMLVNQLGLGNSHRFAFSITGTNASTTAANNLTFLTELRNYDPITHLPTQYINNVKYSYRLVHDGGNATIGALPTFTVVDMEEFTTDTTGNAWSSVAGIADSFYGNTSLFWTDTPSLFNFGVYYDGMNAMGGHFKPRHALTYDDAGGLKYLYQTNTYVYETLDPSVVLVRPATFLPPHMAIHFPRQDGKRFPVFPRRGLGAGSLRPGNAFTSPWRGYPGMGATGGNATAAIGLQTNNLRGGVDKLQFYHQPFDSLLGTQFTPTNFVWTDTFIFQPTAATAINVSDTAGNVIGTFNSRAPGMQWLSPNPNTTGATFWPQPQYNYQYSQQIVGRNVSQPDFLITADYLPNSPDGVPIGWQRSTNSYQNNAGINPQVQSGGGGGNGTSVPTGPGIMLLSSGGGGGGGGNATAGNATVTYTFTKLNHNNFEVIWSGEASVVGNLESLPTLWGWIKGPGPNDLVVFPQGNTFARLQNTLIPDVTPPTISMVSDSAGLNPIERNTITRTEEVLTLLGKGLASTTAIEILVGDLVLQTIVPADQYIVSDNRIDIPTGVITSEAEGPDRQIRVWNASGPSELSVEKFAIETGKPMLTSTDYDGVVYDRAQAMTLRGYGFKSKADGEKKIAYIRVDNSDGGSIDDKGTADGGAPTGQPKPIAIEVVDDRLAFLPLESIKAVSDGSNRRLRVSRKVEPNVQDTAVHLSPGTNPMFAAITTKPIVNTLAQLKDDAITWENITTTEMFKRDRILEINGTGLNTTQVIEVVMQDGTSFPNPVFIQLPNAGVVVEDNGTRIQMSANTIPYPDADTNSSIALRGFKVYNAIGNTDLNASLMFAVNMQPVVDAIGGFSVSGYFNRDKTLGDDVSIFGTGFLAINSVIFTDDDDTGQNRITIALPSPGITVTDSQINIDTETFQIGNAADTDMNSSRRRIKLNSARDNATSPAAQRFYVGVPPTMGTLSGLTAGSLHYRRDNDTLMVSAGTGYGHIQQVELVDALGNPIAGIPALLTGADGTGGTGLLAASGTSFSIAPNPVGWSVSGHLMDAVGTMDRRIKITTPFGAITSRANATEAFTVSATPVYKTTVEATFAGGGYDGGSNTYTYTTAATSALVINGENFRGVKNIKFEDSSGGVVIDQDVNPAAPPGGLTFNDAGTQITIQPGFIASRDASWLESSGAANRRVRLTSAASQNTLSLPIITSNNGNIPAPTFTSLGAFASAGNFQRDVDALVFTGTSLGEATSITLVDAAGADIAGVTPITIPNAGVTVTLTSITVNANTFGDNAIDSVTAASRRVKVTTVAGSATSTTATAFTVSATPDVLHDADKDLVFAGSGYVPAYDAYGYATGASLTITSQAGADMRGVTSIGFYTGASQDGANITLAGADYTVSVDGTTITIIDSKVVAAWYGTQGTTDTKTVKLTTVAGAITDSSGIGAGTRPTIATITDGGAYVSASNIYKRTGEGTVVGTGFSDTSKKGMVMIDEAGNQVGVITAAPTVGSATSLTLAVNLFADANFAVDSNGSAGSGRLLRYVSHFGNATLPSAAGAGTGYFSVSAKPTKEADQDAMYGTAWTGPGVVTNGYNTTNDTYTYGVGQDLVITVQDARMQGVKEIELWRQANGTPAKVGVSLTPVSWTVNAIGKQIHIPSTALSGGGYVLWNEAGANAFIKIITSGSETEDTITLPIKVVNVP